MEKSICNRRVRSSITLREHHAASFFFFRYLADFLSRKLGQNSEACEVIGRDNSVRRLVGGRSYPQKFADSSVASNFRLPTGESQC